MPRNGSGSYSLPQSAFVAGTTISSAAMNSDLSDIAAALTASLPRDGQAGMTGQLKLPDGSAPSPALTFSNEANTGFTRVSAGVMGLSILGTQLFTFTATGANGNFQGGAPVGATLSFAGTATPTGWLLCFGQAVSRTTFALLFAAIGTTWGSGDGATTFNVPDGRNYAFVGKGNMGGSDAGRLTTAFYGTDPTVLGNAGGLQSRSLITANLPVHTPAGTVGITDPTHIHGVGGGCSNGTTTGGGVFPAGTTTAVNSSAAATGITASFSGTSIGSATAFSFVQPSLVMNTIIYAGA